MLQLRYCSLVAYILPPACALSPTYNGRALIYTILILINGIKNMFVKQEKNALLFSTWQAS
jgi:hypothetical protein